MASRVLSPAALLLPLLALATLGPWGPPPAGAQELRDPLPESYALEGGRIVPTTLPHSEAVMDEYLDMPESKPGAPMRDLSTSHQRSYKLWRGIQNTLLGWVEIPVQIAKDTQTTDPFAGFFTGLGRGTVRTFQRSWAGLTEIVTFWDAGPGQTPPLMEPEFVMDEFTP